MWPLVTYSNYFEIVSTVTILHSPTELIPGVFLFKTVIADNLAKVVEDLYYEPVNTSSTYLFIASICFSLQIYCDFVGYSRIAISPILAHLEDLYFTLYEFLHFLNG